MTDVESVEIQSRIVLDTQEEYKRAVLESEQEVLNRLPMSVINKNSYLKWRVDDTVSVSNQFCKLFATTPDGLLNVSEVFNMCQNKIHGSGFLYKCSWDVCWKYGLKLYEQELLIETLMAQNEQGDVNAHLDSKEVFMNDHMSSVFIDKILCHAYYETGMSEIWPICVSGIPEIETVNWCKDSVKVIKGAEFVFRVDDRLPLFLHEWKFKPPMLYFAMDLMLLLPQYKSVFQNQLEEDRHQVLEHKENDAGYQLVLADKMKRSQNKHGQEDLSRDMALFELLK